VSSNIFKGQSRRLTHDGGLHLLPAHVTLNLSSPVLSFGPGDSEAHLKLKMAGSYLIDDDKTPTASRGIAFFELPIFIKMSDGGRQGEPDWTFPPVRQAGRWKMPTERQPMAELQQRSGSWLLKAWKAS
jgi:hypothetical protein